MKRRLFVLIFSIFLANRPSASFGRDVAWTAYGLRPLAMGNAFVSVADDFNALYYNPAGLARLKDWSGELINPSFEFSKNLPSAIHDATTLTNNSSDSAKSVMDLLEKQTGQNYHVAVGWTPHLIFKNFGFGLSLQIVGDMEFHRYPSVDLDFGPRIIVPISIAHNFLEDRLSVGFTVKGRATGGVNHEFSIQDIQAFQSNKSSDSTNLTDFVEGGTAVGADAGLLFTPIKYMEPTLGISVTDIGGTPYKVVNVSGKAKIGAPPPVPSSINAGVSCKPWSTEHAYLLTAVDMHSINQPFSFSKKLNAGLELGLGSIFKVETGLHQGYLSGGMQFDVGLLSLRLVSYAEELGTVAGTTESRRYALQLKLLI